MKNRKNYLLIFGIAFGIASVHGADLEEAPAWIDFNAKKAANDMANSPLLDFSYAGYAFSERAIPNTASWDQVNVTDHGANPDDEAYDDAGIQAAINAAQSSGRPTVVFFPAGRYKVSSQEYATTPLRVTKSGIVLKGAGSGSGGTEIWADEHGATESSNNRGPWRFIFRPNGTSGGTDVATVTEGVQRGSFYVKVDDPRDLRVGEVINLHQETTANLELNMPGFDYSDEWDIKNRGLTLNERHVIRQINGNYVWFENPVHIHYAKDLSSTRLQRLNIIEDVGVEDILFSSGWGQNSELYEHHKNDLVDYAWNAVQLQNVHNGWVRNCEFKDWNNSMAVYGSLGVTVADVDYTGKQGHASYFVNSSYGTLFVRNRDYVRNDGFNKSAGHGHGPGMHKGSTGTVFLSCLMNKDQPIDCHGNQPYGNLLDDIQGGIMYGSGGALNTLPHSGPDLTFWNFVHDSADASRNYDFWDSAEGKRHTNSYADPKFFGFRSPGESISFVDHGIDQLRGQTVYPRSLFKAQLQMRLYGSYVSASSETSDHPAENANTNAANTSWISDGPGAEEWLAIDLGIDQWVGGLTIDESEKVNNYRIEHWNGTDWSLVHEGFGLGPNKEIDFEPLSTRRIRLRVLSMKAEFSTDAVEVHSITATMVPPPPLVAHWPFDEGSGTTAADASNNGYDGTLLNGVSWGSDATRGSFVSFDGTDDRIETLFQTDLTADSGNFTWAVWVNNQAAPDNGVIIGNRKPDLNSQLNFCKLTSRKVNYAGGGRQQNVEFDDMDQASWHHHAVVKSGSTLNYYRDGVFVDNTEITTFAEGLFPFYMGGDPAGSSSEHFQGSIDDVVLYPRSLSEPELVNVMNGYYASVVSAIDLGSLVAWKDGSTWSDGSAPHIGFDYLIPATGNVSSDTGTSTFAGDSLTIEAGGKLQIQSFESDGDMTTVNHLICLGGTSYSAGQFAALSAGNGTSATNLLDGTLSNSGHTRLLTLGSTTNRSLMLISQINGDGHLQAWEAQDGQGGANVIIANDANTFSGTWETDAGSTLIFATAGSVGPADIEVLDTGKLKILGNWQSAGTLTVPDTTTAQVDIGSYTWSVSNVVFAGASLDDGDYDAAELNALGTHAVFIGSGTLRVGAGDPRVPIAHWKLDETSGTTAADSSGNGYNGTLVNGVIWSGDATRASFASFDGTDDRVTTDFMVDITGEAPSFTWCAWVNNQAVADTAVILGNRYPLIDGKLNFFKLTPTRVDYYGGGSGQRLDIGPMPINEWHHYAVVKSGTSIEYFVDGVWVANRSITKFADDLFPFFIGGDPDGNKASEHFQGFVDDVVLYDLALTSNEVVNVKNGIYGGSEPAEPPMLDFGMSGGDMVFNWTGDGFKVQSRTNLTDGTWIDVPGGDTPPVTNSTIDPEAFFRLIEQ